MIAHPAPFLSVYRPHWLWRAFAIVFFVFSVVFASIIWRIALLGLADRNLKEMIIPAVFVLAGAGMTIHAFTVGVRFTVDAVEYRSLIGVKKLPLDKIRGRRECVVRGDEGGGTRYLKLESDDDRFPALNFSKSYSFDDAFYKWFYSLPDLDQRDKEAPKTSNFGLV
jgi:hypothetical protein